MEWLSIVTFFVLINYTSAGVDGVPWTYTGKFLPNFREKPRISVSCEIVTLVDVTLAIADNTLTNYYGCSSEELKNRSPGEITAFWCVLA